MHKPERSEMSQSFECADGKRLAESARFRSAKDSFMIMTLSILIHLYAQIARKMDEKTRRFQDGTEQSRERIRNSAI